MTIRSIWEAGQRCEAFCGGWFGNGCSRVAARAAAQPEAPAPAPAAVAPVAARAMTAVTILEERPITTC
jgi:hypothetical protein